MTDYDRETIKDAEQLLANMVDTTRGVDHGRAHRDRVRFQAALEALRYYREEHYEQ